MAEYGSNALAVRFFRTEVPELEATRKSIEMPVASPMMGSLHPGIKDVPLPGRRYPTGMRNQPWRSWLQSKRSGIKRKRRNRLASLMS